MKRWIAILLALAGALLSACAPPCVCDEPASTQVVATPTPVELIESEALRLETCMEEELGEDYTTYIDVVTTTSLVTPLVGMIEIRSPHGAWWKYHYGFQDGQWKWNHSPD